MGKNVIDWIALVLVIIGGINWGLVGIIEFNLVDYLLGTMPVIVRIIYSLVGLAALYMIYYISR